jgi:hypothetical protein
MSDCCDEMPGCIIKMSCCFDEIIEMSSFLMKYVVVLMKYVVVLMKCQVFWKLFGWFDSYISSNFRKTKSKLR